MTEELKAEMVEPEMVPAETPAASLPAPFDLERALARFEDGLAFRSRVLDIAIKHTSERDWVDFNGTARLGASGCAKLLDIFGLEFRNRRSIVMLQGGVPLELPRSDDWKAIKEATVFLESRRDRIAGYGMTGEARSRMMFLMCYGRWPEQDEGWIEIVGGRSAEDEFFSAQQKLDIMDVWKSGETNWLARAVTTVLGLGGMKSSDLRANGHAQVGTAEQMPSFKGGGSGTAEEQQHREEIVEKLREMSGGDDKAASDMLYDMTKFTGRDGKEIGVRSPKKLKGKWLGKTVGQVRAAYAEWAAGIGADAKPEPTAAATQPKAQTPRAAKAWTQVERERLVASLERLGDAGQIDLLDRALAAGDMDALTYADAIPDAPAATLEAVFVVLREEMADDQ